MTEKELAKVLEKADEERCVAFFKDMTEKERRALAPYCQEWHKKIDESWLQVNFNTFKRDPLYGNAKIALFATASLSELKKRPFYTRPTDELTWQLMMDRRPEWMSDWVPALLEESSYWEQWNLIRRFITAGLVKKPDHPNYYLGMISGLGRRFSEESIEEALLKDPELLEDEVWRLFEFEGGGENSLANWDRFAGGQTWREALVSLSSQGHLSRQRLLECAMEALERDFNHYRAKWFASFYDALEPTTEEQQQHADRYLALLGVSASNIVTWAFAKVEAASKEELYATDDVVAGIQPVLEARSKGIVKKAIRLLKRVAKKNPDSSVAIAQSAAVALGHEEADVQATALDLIEQVGDPDNQQLAELLADYQDVVAPSLKKRLAKLTGTDRSANSSASAKARSKAAAATIDLSTYDARLCSLFGIEALAANLQQERFEFPAASFNGMDVPRLDPKAELTPIDNLDDLIDACARVVEDESRVDDAELAMDALARLGDQKGDDFEARVAPLLKRVRQQMKRHAAPFIGFGPAQDLFGIVYAWCTGTVVRAKGKRQSRSITITFEGKDHRWYIEHAKPSNILSRRSLALAESLANGQSIVLLSTPTHSGGWIDPRVLVQRVNAWQGSDPNLTDVCLAMLRCAPDDRQEALKELKTSSSEWERAIRHALGGQRVRIGRTECLWAAAARARDPWSDDPRVAKAFAKLGPDGGLAATYEFGCKQVKGEGVRLEIKSQPALPKKVQPDTVTVWWHRQLKVWSRSLADIDWSATIWPQARESFFACGALQLASNLDWWEADWENKNYLKPLLEPKTPLREMGLLQLLVGLAAKEPGEHGLAIDAAICAIEDGRLGTDNLGHVMAQLLPTGLVMPPRWAKTLAEVARISPVHAAVVQGSLQRSFRGDPGKMPRNFAKLLELAKELSVQLEQGIFDEEARDFLARFTGSSKAAKTAKALLAIPLDESFEASRPVLEEAIRQRLEKRLEGG